MYGAVSGGDGSGVRRGSDPVPQIPIASSLDDGELARLKHRYWSKSITGGPLIVAHKALKTILFFIGTAGLNAFTQEKILGHHSDDHLPEPCTSLISQGADFSPGALIPLMVFFTVTTCITNFISRAKALGDDNDGFGVLHDLNAEQKRRFCLLDASFKKIILFPDGENILFMPKADQQVFGNNLGDILNYMYAKYGRFKITSEPTDVQSITGSRILSSHAGGGDLSAALRRLPGAIKYNLIAFNCDGLSSRLCFQGAARIIHVGLPTSYPRWSVLSRWQWRDYLRMLGRSALWLFVRGVPALFIVLQINKALYSLEKSAGLSAQSSLGLQWFCFIFNMSVAVNRALINNRMKGDEVYRLIQNWRIQKKYNIASQQAYRPAFAKALLVSFIPVVVTVMYLAFTGLFFGSDGPLAFGEQMQGLLTVSVAHSLKPSAGFAGFLLNFITYSSTISTVVVGLLTQCRSMHTQLYTYFRRNHIRSSARKSTFASITPGLLVFYVSTLSDSAQYGLNAFYNAMQAMLHPNHLAVTNYLGACNFALSLSAVVALGIAITSVAWTVYTGKETYESFGRLFKEDPRKPREQEDDYGDLSLNTRADAEIGSESPKLSLLFAHRGGSPASTPDTSPPPTRTDTPFSDQRPPTPAFW